MVVVQGMVSSQRVLLKIYCGGGRVPEEIWPRKAFWWFLWDTSAWNSWVGGKAEEMGLRFLWRIIAQLGQVSRGPVISVSQNKKRLWDQMAWSRAQHLLLEWKISIFASNPAASYFTNRTFRWRLEFETHSYRNGKRGVFTFPWPRMVTSVPLALPPQLLETLGWTLLSHSVHISLLAEILAFLGPRENGRAPEPQQGLPPISHVRFSSLHKSHKLRSVGRSREVLFSQGLSSVKTYPVTELRSLEVVRGEKCPSREGARRWGVSLFSLMSPMPQTTTVIHRQFWLLSRMILPNAAW